MHSNTSTTTSTTDTHTPNNNKKPTVLFILGGPGSGKGTQCELICKNYKFNHLSAGDLLRAQRKKQGSVNGALIQKCIDDGKIVPSNITVNLLQQAMKDKGWGNCRFLIDGFPRNQQNLNVWTQIIKDKVQMPFIIFLDCTEDTMLKRCLKRGQTSQRSDDNQEILRKRFKTFQGETMSVVKHYEKEGKVVHVNSEKKVQEVFEELSKALKEKNLTL